MLNDDKPNVRILVVDDDDMIRKLLRIMLCRAGYEVFLAIDGLEALRRLAEGQFDLVISDVMMPNLDGFGLLERVRANPVTRTLPVILLTARGTANDKAEGLGLGADEYLVKPFQHDELLARIRTRLVSLSVPAELLSQDR